MNPNTDNRRTYTFLCVIKYIIKIAKITMDRNSMTLLSLLVQLIPLNLKWNNYKSLLCVH